MAKTRVPFDAKSVHYALITSVDPITKIPTYGDWKPINCPTEFSAEAVGEISSFYCGGGVGAKFSSNGGYTGTITGSMIDEDFILDVLGNVKEQATGIVFEDANVQPKNFGLKFVHSFKEDDAETKDIAFIYYNCVATRPGKNNSTKTETIEGGTEEISITMTPLLTDPAIIKAYAVEGDGTAFDAIKQGVVLPDALNLPTP
jgi:hypothetical protein